MPFSDSISLDPSEGGLEKGFFAGAMIGMVVGLAIAGPVGGIAGIMIGAAVGGLTVVVIHNISETIRERAEAQAKAKLDEERQAFILESDSKQAQQEAKEVELTHQGTALEQEKKAVKAAKEAVEEKQYQAEKMKREAEEMKREVEACKAIIDQKLIELAVERIIIVKDYIDSMKEDGASPEKIKRRLKELRSKRKAFANVFFEDDLRDPKTDALLDDCVKAPDGYYYNRSTLVDIYQEAIEQKIVPVCFKDPSKLLPDPATLPTDYDFLAKIQGLRHAGLAEGLSVSSLPNPEFISKVPVVETPTLIEKVSMPSQVNHAQEKTFLRAPEGYCAFFIPEQGVVSSTNPHPAFITEKLTDVAVVVERQVLQGI